jgi:two-component system, sensor histidine kinase and response regulator
MYSNLKNTEKQFLILIVDDVEENVQLLGNILQEQKFDVSFASNGKYALEVLESETPDLIMLDIMMPDMDGFEICKKIKENPRNKDIPIIFLTAKTQQEDIIKGFEMGAVDYVTKPFELSELLARVNNHLSLKKAKDELKESNLTKSKFFSIITNDIKDILLGIKSFSSFMLQEINSNDYGNVTKYAKILNNDASKLFEFTENIIEWVNIQTNNFESSNRKIKIKELANDVVRSLNKSISQKNLIIEEFIDEKIIVDSDLNAISTILNKLLNNAIKYSYLNGRIILNAVDKDKYIEMSITDNGVGIETTVANKVFRLDTPYPKTTGTNNEGGTGLGLIICKSLVEKIEGRIWLESKKHKGTSVCFMIPKSK